VALTETHHPDLVFLDIRMPGMTGVEAARAIAQLPTDDDSTDGWPGCEIVFITAYDQYAIEAFEQGVVDYVLKPAERERLLVTVERIRKRLAQRHAAGGDPGSDGSADGGPPPAALQQLLQRLAARMDPGRPPPLRWIQATVGQNIQMIPVDEVLFFISDEKYTRVQTATVEALIRKPIKELIEELDAEVFWQIHRSTLVNTKFIAGVSRDLRGRQLVAVKGHPERLEVSRSFTGLFKGM
jgi:DNA-binding LytR/AlgR family response regulator